MTKRRAGDKNNTSTTRNAAVSIDPFSHWAEYKATWIMQDGDSNCDSTFGVSFHKQIQMQEQIRKHIHDREYE